MKITACFVFSDLFPYLICKLSRKFDRLLVFLRSRSQRFLDARYRIKSVSFYFKEHLWKTT